MQIMITPLASVILRAILLAAFIVIELATVNLVTVWFAVGSLAALVSGLFTQNLLMQVLVFALVSALALALSKPLVDKARRMKPAEPVGLDCNLGRTATVLLPIAPGQLGRVQLDGVDWTATSTTPLAAGESCVVTAIGATTLTVEPLHAAEFVH